MRTGHFLAVIVAVAVVAGCGGGVKSTNSAGSATSAGDEPPGGSVPSDPIAAACENGIARSCLMAASSAREPVRARQLYDRGCELDEALGCLYAGQLWVEAEPTDRTKALARFDKGCALGDSAACYGGGLTAAGLFGGEPDPATAAEFHRRGCNLNLADACTEIGQMLLAGEGVEKNVERGLELIASACDAGEGGACVILGVRAANEGDADSARGFYGGACDAGDGRGCTLLATTSEDEAAKEELFKRGCVAEVPDPRACTFAAVPAFEGDDPAEAIPVFRDSCGFGEAMGCWFLAVAYAQGRGVAASEALSAEHLELACEADPDRCEKFRSELERRSEE